MTRIVAGSSFDVLRNERRWVGWRNDRVKTAKGTTWTKRCYTPGTARLASTTDPSYVGRHFDAAMAMKGCDGPGFVLTGHENLCGIDLDWAFDPASGLLRPWAAEIVDAAGTYTELSPTPGKGVHFWGIVADDVPTLGFNLPMGEGGQHVEVYIRGGGGRYLDGHQISRSARRGRSSTSPRWCAG